MGEWVVSRTELELFKGQGGGGSFFRVGEDRFFTLWFLRGVSTQYAVRVPLDLGERFLARVDQGWLEVAVRQGVHETRQVLLRRVRVLCDQVPTVVLLLGIVIVIPLILASRG